MAVTLIAEFGSSPAPEWNLRAWLEVAQWCGADAAKVQLFLQGHFPVEERDAKRALEFPRRRWADFVQLAHEYRLLAGASVFDREALHMVSACGDFIKVASREEKNSNLLDYIAAHNPKCLPIYRSVSDPRMLRYGGAYGLGDVVLATVPRYPVPLARALLAVLNAAHEFREMKRAWGWSSHTTGWLDCWLAARLGAQVIEKHLALNRDDREAGHSLLPDQFRQLKERIT